MKASVRAWALTLLAALPLFSVAAADEFDPLRKALQSNGITFYKPINSVYGTGWLFYESADAAGNRFPVTICRDAYAGVANASLGRNVIIPSGTVTRTSDISFSLSLLEKLLRNVASATLGLKRGGINAAEITWGPVSLIELSERNQEDGTQRQVSSTCAKNVVPYLDEQGRFTEKVYIVRRVAAVRELTYLYQRGKQSGMPAGEGGAKSAAIPAATGASNTNVDASAQINLKELLTFSGNVKFLEDSRLGFVVQIPKSASPIHIGANAVRVKSWKALTAVSPQAQIGLDASDQADVALFDQ